MENERNQGADAGGDYEREPGLLDGLRYLYLRRLRLAVYFAVVFAVSSLWYIRSYLTTTEVAEGAIKLAFRGIEKHEYPNGRRFTVEDLRSPDLLSGALKEADIPQQTLGIPQLAAHLDINPIIPAEILARWRKQEKDGVRLEEYYPNEFKIVISAADVNRQQKLRLFDAIVKQYQQRVKFEKTSALHFESPMKTDYVALAKEYDFWDIPERFRDRYRSISQQLQILLAESDRAQDPRFLLSFREISNDLNNWEATRLTTIEALTYQGRLVKDRDIVERRIAFRIDDLDIEIRRKTEEIREVTRLLEILERPKALLAGQLKTREGLQVVDSNILENLIKNDYVGPVVERVLRLQEEIQYMEARKERLQKQLALLPKASNLTVGQLPAGYKVLVDALSSELWDIVTRFNSRIDEYMTSTVSSLVSVRQAPFVTRPGYPPVAVLAGLAFASLGLAVVLLAIESVLKRIRNTGV